MLVQELNTGDNDRKGWALAGLIQDEIEIPYLHPDHAGYPSWPGDQRLLGILKSHWGTNIIFTNGLSNNDHNAYELYLETTDQITHFSSSWEANLLYELGRILPNVTDLRQRLTKNTYLSIQLKIDDAPSEWSLPHKNGNIGVFFGIENPQIAKLAIPFEAVNVKLLRPAETAFIIKYGDAGRKELASRFLRKGGAEHSSLARNSVIEISELSSGKTN